MEAIRKVIRKNLDKKVEEGIQYGMVGYYLPHSVYPDGYHADPKQPLPFVSLASQKSYIGIYLFCVYCSDEARDWLVSEWKKTGKKLDMGKSCIRVKKLEDVPLDVLGKVIQRMKVKDFVASYEAGIGGRASGRKKAKPTRKKAAKKAKPARKKAAKKAKPARKKAAKKAKPARKKASRS